MNTYFYKKKEENGKENRSMNKRNASLFHYEILFLKENLFICLETIQKRALMPSLTHPKVEGAQETFFSFAGRFVQEML